VSGARAVDAARPASIAAAERDRPPELAVRGPRLTLRYPRAGDAPTLFALARDEEVTRYFSWGPYTHEEQAAAWLATLPARRGAGLALELGIADADDELIGITLLCEFSQRDRRCVVGTWLGRAHWGTGANREAKALIARLAFDSLGIERLGAYADVRNARSQAALERLGFEREGVLHAFHRHGDVPRDVATYALLRRDWAASPLAEVRAEIVGALPPGFAARPSRITTVPSGDALRDD
jgi:[ribosomal protein S5]-alanine N-acetyltransferase